MIDMPHNKEVVFRWVNKVCSIGTSSISKSIQREKFHGVLEFNVI